MELRQKLLAFMDEHVYPNEETLEEAPPEQTESLIRDLQSRTKKMGYWAPHLPKEAGGMGIGFMPYVYMNEILGRSYLAPRAFGLRSRSHSSSSATSCGSAPGLGRMR